MLKFRSFHRSDRTDRWQRRAEREQLARHEAERLLESKSLELFEANQRLTDLNAYLEQRVKVRTVELARAADARSEFLAAMSHEIRTPMTAVLGMIDLLRAEDLTPKQMSFVESVHASGRHLLVIINDILDFSRIESGEIELEHENFSIPAVLESVRSMLNPLAQERGLRLCFNLIESSHAVVKGDATRVKQVLLNLVGNAIKFTAKGGVVVTVSFERAEDRLRFRFEVSDSGIGISTQNQHNLFRAFTQADGSTTRKFGGSGLGLAISKRLVDAMGGEIGARRNPQGGSTFWFEVPLDKGCHVALPESRLAAQCPSEPRRILVAEDIALNRDVISAMLERDGHSVTFAEDGRAALELVQQAPFDLILMDVQMPVMDGFEATREIRKLTVRASDIPIIGLTANVMAAEQQKCLEAGMDIVLMKPIDWERLEGVIARCPLRIEPAKAARR